MCDATSVAHEPRMSGPGQEVEMANLVNVRCYLRDPLLRKAFAEAVEAYRTNSPAFFAPDGSPAATNSAATMFWRGFNDTKCGYWDRASTATFGYAYWKAGKAVRAAVDTAAQSEAA